MDIKVKNHLWIASGSAFLALGVIGIFIPVLPTTPFLLLAAACYARGSRRLYTWLMKNRLFGIYIRNYMEGKGMPFRVKLVTLSLLWMGIGLTIIFGVDHWALRTALALIAIGVSIHILLIKEKSNNR